MMFLQRPVLMGDAPWTWPWLDPENWVGLDRWVSPGKAFMGAAWCGPDVPDTACKSLAGGGGSVT